MLLAILAASFLLIATAVIAAGYWFSREKPTPQSAPAVQRPVVFDAQVDSPAEPAWLEFTRTAGQLIPGGTRPDAQLDRELLAAGYLHPGRQPYFRGVQAVAGIGLAILFTVVRVLQGTDLWGSLMAAGAAVALGIMVPRRALTWAAKRRRDAIRMALPPAIDLIVLGLEAGQGIDQSLETAARELRVVHPDLSRELSLLPIQMRAGNGRAEVLNAMAQRVKEPELTRLVSVLTDGDRFGASLAPSLKNHGRYLRTRRRQAAQEQARKVSVKLVFPVFFLIFPAVLLVTLGPAVINLYTGLIPLMMK